MSDWSQVWAGRGQGRPAWVKPQVQKAWTTHRILRWWEGRGGFEVGKLIISRTSKVWPLSWSQRAWREVFGDRSVWSPVYGFFPPRGMISRLPWVPSCSGMLCLLGDSQVT